MADLYTRMVTHDVGGRIADVLGLPQPTVLRRHEPGQPPLEGAVLVGGRGDLLEPVSAWLSSTGVRVDRVVDPPEDPTRHAALVFDATGLANSADLGLLHDFFHTTIRRLGASARVVVVGRPPRSTTDELAFTTQRALEGFVRSLGKELRAGGTANLVEVDPAAESGVWAPLRFLLSGRSAYVSGQRLTVSRPASTAPDDPDRPLVGRTALVTGAARGIGAAIARTLARDGATVVCVDLPTAGDDLAAVANDVGGVARQLDITREDAGSTLVEDVRTRLGPLDIVVHNAGITRDKTIAGMDRDRWDLVLGVNLTAIESLDAALLAADALGDDPRIVCVSSVGGIAGNRGQTNYTTSKAGVIGHVAALAEPVAAIGGTINAVAPGFIETDMTARMPVGTRELGRRLNSLSQGGLPVDVAEAIAFLAWPDADGINGTTLRVCGQSLLGA